MRCSVLLALVLSCGQPDIPISHEAFYNMRIVVNSVRSAPTIYACPDGRIDVFRTLFADTEINVDTVAWLWNDQAEQGPTPAEVRAGDYRNFAFERARVHQLGGKPVPMLWDFRAYRGYRLVGLSNGAVKALTEEEFAELRSEGQ